jgi:hypothetical protein
MPAAMSTTMTVSWRPRQLARPARIARARAAAPMRRQLEAAVGIAGKQLVGRAPATSTSSIGAPPSQQIEPGCADGATPEQQVQVGHAEVAVDHQRLAAVGGERRGQADRDGALADAALAAGDGDRALATRAGGGRAVALDEPQRGGLIGGPHVRPPPGRR